ncbi:MAG: hypothetical protein H5T98_02630 [Syntrophomonadaceae bacterium]|nr:hypothetical protein [Syntrophomonadaceae bacterium]
MRSNAVSFRGKLKHWANRSVTKLALRGVTHKKEVKKNCLGIIRMTDKQAATV